MELKADEKDRGKRIDVFLSEQIEKLTRNAAQLLLQDGNVLICGQTVKKNYKLNGSEIIWVSMPELKSVDLKAEDIPLEIRYEDNDVAVINKPRGMVVHPAAGHPNKTLVNALMFRLKDSLSGINGELRPGIVHRIDKDTSGLLIVAKNDFAHERLAMQLKDHTLSRVYEAVVCGKVKDDKGTISVPVGRHRTERKKMATGNLAGTVKNAVTHYEVLERFDGYTYLRCRLETGRTHQIRVHMAHLGHPVAGDPVYGPKKDPLKLGGQCLHAAELSFMHPRSEQKVTVTAPLPDYFVNVLKILRSKDNQ
ncbi:MAG: RluA family pseudouridine synthase [Clostridiales bacterium]|nr:RluA family pseudouridine synthase [Clostridiales bacterium]